MTQMNTPGHTDELQAAGVTAFGMALAVGWPTRTTHADLPPPYGDLTYVESAHLLLVPCSGSADRTAPLAERPMRLARADAIVVAVAIDEGGSKRLEVSIGLWSARAIDWHHGLLPWVSEAGEVWIVSVDGERSGVSFRLGNQRLRAVAPPWQDAAEREVGLAYARRLFARGA